jgi:hypothetical protein
VVTEDIKQSWSVGGGGGFTFFGLINIGGGGSTAHSSETFTSTENSFTYTYTPPVVLTQTDGGAHSVCVWREQPRRCSPLNRRVFMAVAAEPARATAATAAEGERKHRVGTRANCRCTARRVSS